MPTRCGSTSRHEKEFIIMEISKPATAWPEELPPIEECDASTLITWLPLLERGCAAHMEVLGVLYARCDLYDVCDKLMAAVGDRLKQKKEVL
jgi:hypothetical protein